MQIKVFKSPNYLSEVMQSMLSKNLDIFSQNGKLILFTHNYMLCNIEDCTSLVWYKSCQNQLTHQSR